MRKRKVKFEEGMITPFIKQLKNGSWISKDERGKIIKLSFLDRRILEIIRVFHEVKKERERLMKLKNEEISSVNLDYLCFLLNESPTRIARRLKKLKKLRFLKLRKETAEPEIEYIG